MRQGTSIAYSKHAWRRPGFGFVAAFAVLLTAANFAFAQQSAAPTAAASAPQRDAKAIEALTAMGKYLRSLKACSLHAESATDEVLSTGQKIQFAGSLEYTVEFPSRMRAEVRSDSLSTSGPVCSTS